MKNDLNKSSELALLYQLALSSLNTWCLIGSRWNIFHTRKVLSTLLPVLCPRGPGFTRKRMKRKGSRDPLPITVGVRREPNGLEISTSDRQL